MSSSYFVDSRLAKKSAQEYVTDKELSADSYIRYMIIRLQKMFKYENLPDTIPKEYLENYLLLNGTCFVTQVDGKLYALNGTYGGEPDAYYRPTKYVVANPGLKLSKTYDINNDGVLMRNDPLWIGLYPLMARYATLMSENILTIRVADIMLRVMAMLTAPDDKTKIAAEEFLKKLEKGEIGVIGENRFFDDGVKMQSPPSNNGSYLTQFIELQQYFKGSFYNEIGLNANFNMKREAIGDGESSLNEDSLLPLCEQMLQCRQEDIDKLNKMFGTEISVDFDSAWKNNQKAIQIELEKTENEASQLAEGGDENEVTQVTEGGDENEASQLAESCDEEISNEGGDEEISNEDGDEEILNEGGDEECSNEDEDENKDKKEDN